MQEERRGYRGQLAHADCAELAVRELLSALLWDPVEERFEPSRLPASSRAALQAFYARAAHGGAYAPDASAKWHAMVSNLPGVTYLSGERGQRYEMAPTASSVLCTLSHLLRAPLTNLADLEAIWREAQPERAVRLRLRAHPVGVQIEMRDGPRTASAANATTAAAATATTAAATEGLPAGDGVVLRLVLAEGLKHAFALRPWQVSHASNSE